MINVQCVCVCVCMYVCVLINNMIVISTRRGSEGTVVFYLLLFMERVLFFLV